MEKQIEQMKQNGISIRTLEGLTIGEIKKLTQEFKKDE